MNRLTWTLTASAVAGIVAGCDNRSSAGGGAPSATPAASTVPTGTREAGAKDCCKGKNDCKGKGGCKTDVHACKGKNECKGQGGCNMRDCT